MKSLMKACDIAGFPPEKLIEYQKQVMNERDARNIIKSAERRGREEGREEERLANENKLIASAKKMVNAGIDVDLVCSTLGVDKSILLQNVNS